MCRLPSAWKGLEGCIWRHGCVHRGAGFRAGNKRFVGSCHMTSERRPNKDPLTASRSVTEAWSSCAARPENAHSWGKHRITQRYHHVMTGTRLCQSTQHAGCSTNIALTDCDSFVAISFFFLCKVMLKEKWQLSPNHKHWSVFIF